MDIVALVRGKLSKLDRCTIGALIVLDVHNQQISQLLLDNQVNSPEDFLWMAQLRYRMDPATEKLMVY